MTALDVVGCGEVTLQFHAPVLRHLRRAGLVRVHGCYDRDAGRARYLSRLLGARTWGTAAPEEPAEPVAGALIATPPESHTPIALNYVRSGRHALVEKPLAGRGEDVELLVAASRQGAGRVLVGHMRRFFPAVQIAREFVGGGGLGEIRGVVATEGGRWAWPAASDYVVTSGLGGVLFDTGSHVLDTILFVLGMDEPPAPRFEVESVRRDRAGEPSHDFRARFSIAGPGRAPIPVSLALSRTQALAGSVRLVGERGTLHVPGVIASAPCLQAGGRVFALDAPGSVRRARDILGALLLEHLALLDVIGRPAARTPLDFERFLGLTTLLQALASAGGA